MTTSLVAAATRAFVKVLLSLARFYELSLQANRDTPPEQLLKAYRRVLLKAHPDKGGAKEHVQELQAAKEKWENARKGKAPTGGRPPAGPERDAVVQHKKRRDYRVHAEVVLLTYQGFEDLEQWHRFVSFVQCSLTKWSVLKWGATLEACETEGLHTHLMLKFKRQVDRTAKSFAFEGLTPNVRSGDYLGEEADGTVDSSRLTEASGTSSQTKWEPRRKRMADLALKVTTYLSG